MRQVDSYFLMPYLHETTAPFAYNLKTRNT